MSTTLDADAERAILATVIHGRVEFAALELRLEDFAELRHRMLFEGMRKLHEQGRPAGDLLEIERVLGERVQSFGDAGFFGFLSSLDEHVTFGNLGVYVERVRRASLTRQVLGGLGDLIAKAKAGELEGPQLLEAAYASLARVAEHRHDDPTQELAEVAERLIRAKLAEVDAWSRGEPSVVRIKTGIAELDAIMGGVPLRKVTVLAGGTSHGKSALARTIAMNVSGAGLGVHVFSMEDDADSFAERVLADLANANLFTLANEPERLSPTQMARIVEAGNEARYLERFLVDETPAMSGQRVAVRTRKHKPRNATRLVVVDYLQQMRDPSVRQGDKAKTQHVDAAMDALVELSRHDDVAVLALCQLSRDAAKEGRPPELSDLRWSGEIEQQAHSVIAVYRPEKDARSAEKQTELRGRGLVRVLKNKKGGVGECELFFDAPTATYRSPAWMRANPQMELEVTR